MARLRPKGLRCEYRVNPLGIDVPNPRLSWELEPVDPESRGARQTAYRIIVSSSRENLERDVGDLWDTGRVELDETAQIVYSGEPLRSGMECWWKVMIWDDEGEPSEWSEPARWSMGLLRKEDWRAKWIGYDEPAEWEERLLTFEDCRWIWFPEGNPRLEAPAGRRYFRRRFEIPTDREIKRARMILTVDDQFVLFANGREIARSDGKPKAWDRPQVIDLAGSIRPGRNVIALEAVNEGGPAGVLGKLVVEFESGEPLIVSTDKSWRASTEAPEGWREVDFDDSGWAESAEIGGLGSPPWGVPGGMGVHVPPPPFLRKSFRIDRPVKRAMIYVSALGSCELRLNGRRVSDDYFIPGWSDFRKRAYYRAYEATELLREGENVIGVILADEWFAGYCGGWGRRGRYGEPRVILQMEIEFEDGSKELVITDGSWKAAYGPILEADFYMGEAYDARREMPGWDSPGFDDRDWRPVVVDENVNLELTAHPGVPVRKTMELPAKSVREVEPGVFVFDMGQNMIGVARLKVKGAEPGRRIALRFAEVLNPDGTIYTTNLRKARNRDLYICKGGEEEVWEPRFTFRGFRYVEVRGYPGKPPLDAVTGVVFHSDVPMAGEFECSSDLVNRLVENIRWSLRGNYLEVPTDCPQRDERQGWTGDAQIFVRTASYLADVSAFMTKWLIDLNDGQREDGAYPDVAPVTGAGFGTPAWGDAGIIVPYTLWRVYGDTRIIERHYERMARYIDHLVENSRDYLRPAIGYGDWVPAGAETPKDVLATAYFAYVVKLMAEMAAAIGREEDSKRFAELFGRIREAFNKAYVSGDGRIKGETQTVYALALDLDLLPEELRPLALEHLISDIEKRGWHLSTGFVGTRHLMLALTKMGRADVAYKLLLQESYPSWLYMVRMGATTIWERWDGYTEERGFQTPDMNSFNHYAFGSVGEWLFRAVAGIEEAEPGFKRIIIRPHIDPSLSFVRASYRSIRGPIEVEWRVEEERLALSLSIPPNVTAELHLPTSDPSKVGESGRPADRAEGVKLLRSEEGKAVYEVLPGTYRFETPL
ncbi:rhamnosidase [Candidatus Poribacteria bacterium]|nr:MAG: rhamnosidase [Candidatus Poribacteria bacterium]